MQTHCQSYVQPTGCTNNYENVECLNFATIVNVSVSDHCDVPIYGVPFEILMSETQC